ncbi:unnamed protein product [Sympodiomycopsis kandeliae]
MASSQASRDQQLLEDKMTDRTSQLDKADVQTSQTDNGDARSEYSSISASQSKITLDSESTSRSENPHDDAGVSRPTSVPKCRPSERHRKGRVKNEVHHDDEEEEPHSIRASRFTLWETRTRFYLVSYNTAQTRFRILKVDRTPEGHQQQQQQQAQQHATFRAGGDHQHSTHAGSGRDEKDGTPTTASDGARMSSKESMGSLAQPGSVLEHSKGKDSVSSGNASAGKQSTQTQNPSTSSADFWALGVTTDQAVYDRSQITELLDMISEGNRTTGGLKEVGHFFGLVGFIRFTSTYYMVLISRRSVVALLGGHYIYHCDETKILPVCHPSFMASVQGRTKVLEHDEARLLHTFKQVDLSKNFYFSYTYDLTRTLQENLTGTARGSTMPDDSKHTAWGYCEKFIWNHHLLQPAFGATEHAVTSDSDSPMSTARHDNDWVLPLCYGFVDQAKLSVMNRCIHVTLIARRSRHFAGARFLKRGADEAGHVANDVETEQIVSEALTSAFFAPASHLNKEENADEQKPNPNTMRSSKLSQNPRFTSYVMHRGSIPVFWTQDSTNMSPRPPIEISVVDPFYTAAASHFDEMFARYGSPVIILNLIKGEEKTPRESKLLAAFTECVHYLNQFLPPDKKMIYIPWDMSKASKSRDQDVIDTLEEMAAEILDETHFFHSGPEPAKFRYGRNPAVELEEEENLAPADRHREPRTDILLQTGVARINCVDCLDRTNAAQFVTGKAAFGHQLHAMGLIEVPYVGFDCDAVDMLTEMYHDLGDTIALQYGGSHLVNTMETYRKINQWTSHSRDMLEGLKRYYANSFVDADKQAAINLFLGITRDAPEFAVGSVVDSTKTSSGMQKSSLKNAVSAQPKSYRKWYTPEHLVSISATHDRKECLKRAIAEEINFFWAEYYRPRLFTDFSRHHIFKMTGVHQMRPASIMVTNGQAGQGGNPMYGSGTGLTNSQYPSSSSSSIMSSFYLPSSPTKKPLSAQQKERLRRESITSATPSSPGSPTLGRLRMSISGPPRTRADSLTGSSLTMTPRPLVTTAGGTTYAGNGSMTSTAMATDAPILITSPFTSRITGRRSRHQSRPSGSSGGGSGSKGGKYHPRLRAISGSSTTSSGSAPTVAETPVKSASTIPNYTIDDNGTHVHASSYVATSPLANRPAQAAIKDDSEDDEVATPLMGGMRRWMTLNHSQGHHRNVSSSRKPQHQAQGSRSSSKDVANDNRTPGQKYPNLPSKKNNWLGLNRHLPRNRASSTNDETASTNTNGSATQSGLSSSWVNPFPVQPGGQNTASQPPNVAGTTTTTASAQKVQAETLLNDWENPRVNDGEAQEYALWVSQFAGNVKLESSLPEYDALLNTTSEAGDNDDNIQIVLDSTHSLSPSDLKLYVQSVKRATRCQFSTSVSSSIVIPPPITNNNNTASGDGASAPPVAATIDTAHVPYTNLAGNYVFQPGLKGASEGKIRAYKSWLDIGVAGR